MSSNKYIHLSKPTAYIADHADQTDQPPQKSTIYKLEQLKDVSVLLGAKLDTKTSSGS